MKWYTVSKNPVGWMGTQTSYHVEPGKVRGHHQIRATSKKNALRKVIKRFY